MYILCNILFGRIWLSYIIFGVKIFRGQNHQNRVWSKVMHRVPIPGLQDQALVGRIEEIIFFMSCSIITGDNAAPLQTDRRLNGFMMAMAAANRIIYAVNIKNPLDIKRYNPFNYGQIAAFIGIRSQVNYFRHLIFFFPYIVIVF